MRGRRRLIVTGSSGRIGRTIAAAAAKSYAVTGVDIVPSETTDIVADVTDYEKLVRAFDGASALIHSAGLHAPHVGLFSEHEFRRVNVTGTATIIRAALTTGVRHMIFTSTTAVFGVRQDVVGDAEWIDDMSQPHPRTIYHHTKLEAEAHLAAVAGPQLKVTVLRLGRCFPEAVNLMALYRLYRGIDERDAAVAHLRALDADGPHLATHIVSGTTPFLREDRELLGVDAPTAIRLRCPALAQEFSTHGWAFPQAIDRVYDNAGACAALNWHPQFGFEHVLAAFHSGCQSVLPPISVPQ
ncbi:NAD-dependent epimerase/dehydratase family protein [Rhodopseudomonas palustris]|uniref:3-beta hydroxysteroid dehydrogenase/isomerase n=1 Tax=Rhodopseudomonas palustris (strain BisB18) TaxID=316056 RepID=Q20YH6_RHOPB